MISPKILTIFLLVQLCSSGQSKNQGKGQRFRIISGRQADITEFPYQASIEYHYNQWCGGSIIAPKVILTAAHCVTSMKRMTDVPPGLMVVRVGNSESSTGGETHQIKRFIVHKSYGENPNVDEHDIAMIVLSEPLEYSEKVKPIELASTEPKPGQMAWVTGFGRQDPMRRSGNTRHLMAVEIPVMNREKCIKIHKRYGNLVTDKMICAGFESGSKDACKGDSGGPIVSKDKLVGVVAWGLGCGRDGMPGVYTSVARYQKWIDSHLLQIEEEEEDTSKKARSEEDESDEGM